VEEHALHCAKASEVRGEVAYHSLSLVRVTPVLVQAGWIKINELLDLV